MIFFQEKFGSFKKKQYFCTRFSKHPFNGVSDTNQQRVCAEREGELSEWSKEPHSKCGIRITSYRGFESLTLRKAESSGNRVICRNDKRKSIGLPFVIVRISGW